MIFSKCTWGVRQATSKVDQLWNCVDQINFSEFLFLKNQKNLPQIAVKERKVNQKVAELSPCSLVCSS
jgi:hypothetical protein